MSRSTNSPRPARPPIGGVIRQLARLLRPFYGRLLFVLLLLGGLAAVNMSIPACLGLLFNRVFPDQNFFLLWAILPAILGVYIARNALFLGSKYAAVTIGENVCFRLRRRLFERLQARDLQFYRDNNPGQLSSRVMDDTFAIQTFIQEEVPKLLLALCMFVSLSVVLYAVNWRLALVTTGVLPLHLVVFRYFKRSIKQSGHAAQQSVANVHGNLVEKFLGMEVVQGFTAEDRENEAFVDAIDATRRSQLVSKRLHVLQKIVADLLIGFGTVALLGFGGYQVMREDAGHMLPGTFIAFFGFVGMLYPTVAELMGSMSKMVRAGASLDRIHDILSDEQSARARADTFRGPVRGHLSFYWASVRLSDDHNVLKDITLEIPPGTFCVITGPSGSGKSTLVNMVPRFVSPSHGRILLDTMDLSTVDVKRLRDAIGVAFQECYLFNATVLDNLRYANPDATLEDIEKALRLTGADQLIARLPQGLETLLGEQGWNLSRGEKQLLAITRALLKQPRILILDEATSSIDVATERQLIPRIRQSMQGRTTLMVSHRPEWLEQADMVIVLDAGRVAYQGPPGELPPDTLDQLGISTPTVTVTPSIMFESTSLPAARRP